MLEGCLEVFADLKKAEQIVLYRRLCITKFPLPPQLLIMIQEEMEVEDGIQSAL